VAWIGTSAAPPRTVLDEEWMVATVGSLIAALQGLDPKLPVGALRVGVVVR